MKVGIYNEPSGRQAGGGEYVIGVLADALSQAHDVEIVHHNANLTREQLAAFVGLPLSAVSVRYVPREPENLGGSPLPWVRYARSRAWHAGLSEGYDIFINCTHGPPPFCHASFGILYLLFPFYQPPYLTPAQRPEGVLAPVRRAYQRWEWHKRLATYAAKTSISEYTRTWTREWWDIDSTVIHPPVETRFAEGPKAPVILSVGRFTAGRHSKGQLEMAGAFADLVREGLAGWTYATIGGVADTADDRAYVAAVRRAGCDAAIDVQCNAPRHELTSSYERAMIFWHAAGYTAPSDRPDLAEHFGISTVEAMAAGCVPVVINRGGQREIVEHGVSGFLWDTLDELKAHTLQVAQDEALRTRLSQAARIRAQDFRRERFVAQFTSLLERGMSQVASR